MSDVIALSELSDDAPSAYNPSPRLAAVLDRLPENSVRIENALHGRITTLADLQSKTPHDLMRLKNFGGKYIKNVKAALAHFGLTLAGEKPLVVRDHATIAEAQLQRLMDWISERMKAKTSLEERDVLRDAMRVLDGQAPTGQRWRSE